MVREALGHIYALYSVLLFIVTLVRRIECFIEVKRQIITLLFVLVKG